MKLSRVGNSIIGFWWITRFLWSKDQKIDLIKKKIELLPLIFFKDQRDQFPYCPSLIHSWSISKINESKLILSIFKNIEEQRSKGAIHSFGIKGRETVKNIQKYFFFDQITLFCNQRLKDRFDHQKDWIAPWNLFQRSTRPVCSRSIFLKDWWEWFDHGQSFLKIKKSKRLNSQPWN